MPNHQIACPHCGQPYTLTSEQIPAYLGNTINCQRCGKQFAIGGSADAPLAVIPLAQPMSVQPVTVVGDVSSPLNYATPTGPQTTSSMAVVSLVLGILSLFTACLTGIPAIICSCIAFKKTKDPTVGGRGLATAGLVLGIIGTLMSACVISVLLPRFMIMNTSLTRARGTANQIKCASNLRQIGQAIMLYANENKGEYPDKLELLLTTQAIHPSCFICPSTNDTPTTGDSTQLTAGGHLSYIYVGQGLTSDSDPTSLVMYEPLTNHNNLGANFLYADGHVVFMIQAAAQKAIADAKAAQKPPKVEQ